ncbi:DNA/RNA nuclease SfsA [Bdellovibrio bacteriovorus]|uniref:Sugar fermentation stimulation protein homolog n=1 Tax=Bdellovibrio bacteriovorus (strain ATCC 15356 / DSM 50701 / NCIMB 9529 / HD100) TaxID=264462 RepID=SFSA_BDEBA|nr:DNA/RNA nuclease SfsA [Bdellovibrio bacteriovorus]P61662.1 RecName: Full=Sugar fermentation stimulation protein homolog [Bdellovibrio bacteriovorus HD100]AHZ86840.1 sugar fermentation stimulation protein [Bdellovibrio bacteriovorus]BEV67281.1 Sugar fermentation stimulation protein A [Bdellovibrio bacteriovorus]CAE78733.1 sugar fermentation stimulation protein [Bdellovibrio bacteriovorus HD100]
MKFHSKLQEGIFLKRYKRFFADIEFQGQQVTAHVPNTGSLKSVNNPGQHCLFSESTNPERKLKYTLEMIKSPTGSWVGVNTATPNTVVRETLHHVVGHKKEVIGGFAHWAAFDEVKPEYKISAETRLDFALKKNNSDKMHFIEVKNVTLAEEGTAKFPDAVTERGQKHLRELMALMEQGHTAEIVFTIQRHDCGSFSPADDIDPEYGRLLREAYQKGLRVSPFVLDLTPESVELSETVLPLKM